MKESGFQFVQPYLKELFYSENPQFEAGEELIQTIEMHNTVSLQINKCEKEPCALVTLTLEVNQDREDVPFKIKASMSSLFKWKDMNDKQIDRMLRINAPAVLLSYLRPIVAQITNSSQFPVYDIPFLNFADEQIDVIDE